MKILFPKLAPPPNKKNFLLFWFKSLSLSGKRKKINKKLFLFGRRSLEQKTKKKRSKKRKKTRLEQAKAEKEIRVTLIGCSSLSYLSSFSFVSEICNLATFLQTHTHSHT